MSVSGWELLGWVISEITAQELTVLLSGIDLSQIKRRKRYQRSTKNIDRFSFLDWQTASKWVHWGRRLTYTVAIDPQHLPEDPKVLQQMVLDLMAQLDREFSERNKIESLLREMLDAKRLRKSEQLSAGTTRSGKHSM
jgi:hypothetical protein